MNYNRVRWIPREVPIVIEGPYGPLVLTLFEYDAEILPEPLGRLEPPSAEALARAERQRAKIRPERQRQRWKRPKRQR